MAVRGSPWPGSSSPAITLITTSRSSFINSYNTYAKPFTHKSDTYHFFIQKAHSAGVNLSGGTDWHNTIVASGAIIAFGVWVWFSTNLAGEIRQAGTRKNWYSMLGGPRDHVPVDRAHGRPALPHGRPDSS